MSPEAGRRVRAVPRQVVEALPEASLTEHDDRSGPETELRRRSQEIPRPSLPEPLFDGRPSG